MKLFYIILTLLTHISFNAKPPIGFPQCGNSCYMNATIQTLYAMKELKQFIIDNKALYNKSTIALDFANLLETIDTRNLEKIGEKISNFYLTHININFEQADAGSTLQKIFQSLTNIPEPKKSGINRLITQTTRIQSYGENVLYDDSIGTPNILLLNPDSTTKMLENIEKYQEKTEIPEYYSPQGIIKGTEIETLTKTAHYLIFRIAWKENSTEKPQIPVHIAYNSTQKYNLIAAIVHMGTSITSGHYIAFVKTNNTWYKCNDAFITEEKPFILNPGTTWPTNQRPLILVYERDELPSTLTNTSNELSIIANTLESTISNKTTPTQSSHVNTPLQSPSSFPTSSIHVKNHDKCTWRSTTCYYAIKVLNLLHTISSCSPLRFLRKITSFTS